MNRAGTVMAIVRGSMWGCGHRRIVLTPGTRVLVLHDVVIGRRPPGSTVIMLPSGAVAVRRYTGIEPVVLGTAT